MHRLPGALAHTWGRAIAHYGRWSLQHSRVSREGFTDLPGGPVIWTGWHATNLIALAVYPQLQRERTCLAFVVPTLAGETMRAWLDTSGCFEAVLLQQDALSNPKIALRQMSQALGRGRDVVIAVDGPHGPAGRVRPGAVWLARLTGCPIVPAAFAARPAIRAPRWDRQVVPLPGARIAAVFGSPILVERRTSIEGPVLDGLAEALKGATRRAWALVDDSAALIDTPYTTKPAR